MRGGGEWYEEQQRFNAITRVLHATRYRNLEQIVADLSPAYADRLRVVDIGAGPCKSFAVLNALREDIDYTAIEKYAPFCALANERYGALGNFHIHCAGIEERLALLDGADLIVALESFEHIPERLVVRVIEAIGRCDFQRLYVTVPNELGPAIAIKNLGSWLMGYNRHHSYPWRETFYAALCELDKVGIHGTAHKGFDWRWLAQTLRQNVKIIQKYTSPVQWIPKMFSPSIGFLCERR